MGGKGKGGIQLCSVDYGNYQYSFGVKVTPVAATMGLIDAIGDVTAESGDAIAAARASYDALSAAEKGAVTNLDVLTAAETAFGRITNARFQVAAVITTEGSVKVGDEITVNVITTANYGVAALAGTLAYDAAQFELVSIEKGTGLPEGTSFIGNKEDGSFSFYGNEADAKDGIVVATATLRALKASEAATVSVDPGKAALEGDVLEHDVTAGEAASVVVLADALKGDANGNGRVNIVDAQVIYDMGAGRYGVDYSGLTLPEGWTKSTLLWVANVNGDDAIDAGDAFATQRYVHYQSWS